MLFFKFITLALSGISLSTAEMYLYEEADQFPTCSLPLDTGRTYEPPADACPADSSSISVDNAYRIAHLYAPKLFHHQLEKYTMADPEDHLYMGNGSIYRKTKDSSVYHAELNRENLFDTARNLNQSAFSNKYWFNRTDDNENWKFGSGFHANGTSKAPLHYNVYDYDENTWVFNYYIYFAWNGCSNQWMITSFNNTVGSYMYYICNLGIHEGDWEVVSVMVCKNEDGLTKPLAVRYNQHEFNTQFDCSKDECRLEDNHPLGGIALNSHATYPQVDDNIIYIDVPIPFVYNVRGIHLVDRTQRTETMRFEPNEWNVKRIPDLFEVNAASDNTSWAVFAGRWGELPDEASPTEDPFCIDDNQTKYIDCPTDDAIFDIMLGLFGLKGEPGSPFYYNLASAFIGPGKGPEGPRIKDFWNKWTEAIRAPVFGQLDNNNRSLCPNPDDWLDTSVYETSGATNKNDLIAALVGGFIFAIAAAIVLVAALTSRCCQPLKHRYDKTKAKNKVSWFFMMMPRVSPLWTIFFYIITVCGAIMEIEAIEFMIERTLSFYFPGVNFEIVNTIILLLSICLLVFSGIFVLVNCTIFFCIYRNATGGSVPKLLRWTLTKNKVSTFFINGAVGVLDVCIFLAVFLFLIAFVFGGIYFAVAELCLGITDVVPDGVCLNLNGLFGLSELACGDDFRAFCISFGRRETNIAMWGAVLLLLGTFYMFLCGTSMFWHYSYLNDGYAKFENELITEREKEEKLKVNPEDPNNQLAEQLDPQAMPARDLEAHEVPSNSDLINNEDEQL